MDVWRQGGKVRWMDRKIDGERVLGTGGRNKGGMDGRRVRRQGWTGGVMDGGMDRGMNGGMDVAVNVVMT
jgi:hypothetical protein